jgi:hypothetical protein
MDQIRGAVEELHSSSELSSNRMNQIADLGAQLAADIGPIRSGFSAGTRFAEVVNRARRELDILSAGTSQGSLENTELGHLEARYTMQTQRDIHESVLQGTEYVSSSPVETPEAGREEGDLGANVELF